MNIKAPRSAVLPGKFQRFQTLCARNQDESTYVFFINRNITRGCAVYAPTMRKREWPFPRVQ